MKKNKVAMFSLVTVAGVMGVAAVALPISAHMGGFGTGGTRPNDSALQTTVESYGINYDEFSTKLEENQYALRSERYNSSTLSEVLGLSFDEFESLKENGTDLRTYAEENSIDMETIRDAMDADRQADLDEKLASGEIDQETYDEIISRSNEGPRGGHMMEEKGGRDMGMF